MAQQNIQYNFKANVSSALDALKTLNDAFKTLDSQSGTSSNAVSSAFKAVSSSSSKIATAFGKISTASNSISSAFNKLKGASSTVGRVFSTLLGLDIGKQLADGAESAINYVETLNLFKVALGDSIEAGQKFVQTMSDVYGLDPSSIAKTTGLFYEMAAAVEVPDNAAAKLSTNLTALSVDIASLFDYDVETVSNKMISGVRGMSRAVVSLGMDVRASTVEAYANSIGIEKQYATMNEASREILRYIVMVKQASDSQSDFARTIESPANQLRILKEQLMGLGRAIGNFIVAPIANALPYINGFVMAIKLIIQTLNELMGLMRWTSKTTSNATSSFDNVDSAISGVGTTADKTKKKVKDLLAPFDELNVLQDNAASSADTSTGGGVAATDIVDPKILKALDDTKYSMEQVRMKALDVRDAILGFLGLRIVTTFDADTGRLIQKLQYIPEVFKKNLLDKFPEWTKTINALFDVDWSYVGQELLTIAGQFRDILGTAIKQTTSDILALFGIQITDDTVSAFIQNITTNLQNFSQWIKDNKDKLSDIVTRIMEFAIAFKALQIVAPILSGIFSGFSLIATGAKLAVSAFGTVVSVVGTVAGAITTLVSTIVSTLGVTGFAAIALFIAGFIAGFKSLWDNSEQFRSNFTVFIGNIGTLLSSIVTLVSNVVKLVIGIVSPILGILGEFLKPIIILVQGIINAIVGALNGFVTILNGILTGDVSTVIKGFFKIIVSLVEAVMNIGASVVNGIISVICTALNTLGQLVYTVVKGLFHVINTVRAFLGQGSLELPSRSIFVIDNIPQIVPPSFDYAFAKGGVVTGPTRALIGEDHKDEAVIPLSNSPQMLDLIEKIADRVNETSDATSKSSNQPTVLHIYFGEKEYNAFTYKAAQQGSQLVGAQPIKER